MRMGDKSVLDYLGLKRSLSKLKTAVNDMVAKKQDKITGTDGALLGLDGGGVKSSIYPSNPNILDNGYFIGGGSQKGDGKFPINQRGTTESNSSTNLYTIADRYKIRVNYGEIKNAKVSLTDEGIYIDGGCDSFYQVLEKSRIASDVTEITVSILCDIEVAGSIVYGIVQDDKWLVQVMNSKIGRQLITASVSTNKFSENIETFAPWLYATAGTKVTLIAMKLEEGSKQTLAHKEGDKWVLNDPPPNKQVELAKCQRYLVVYNNDASNSTLEPIAMGQATTTENLSVLLTLPQEMRARPTLTLSGRLTARTSNIWRSFYKIDFAATKTNKVLQFSITISDEGGSLTVGAPYEVYLSYAEESKLIISAEL